MDLALSPDWPAYHCYAIVFLIGFLVASLQIERLYQGFPRAWIMLSTWVLFFSFLLLPVVLFWFLDRTNTLHDTSLFGAILVAVAYRQIFAGSVEKVNVPGQVSKIWERLMNWADERAGRIRQKMEENADAFDQKVIASLMSQPGLRDKVLDLLKLRSENFGAIQNELTQLTQQWQSLGPEVSLHKEVDFLFHKLRLVTGQKFADLMYHEKITSWTDYYWYGKELRSRVVQFLVIGVLLMSFLYFFYQFTLNPRFQAGYQVYRLTKVNTTPEDRSRTRRELNALIEQKQTDEQNQTVRYICDQLTSPLRYDAMPVETAERILAVLLEHRDLVCEAKKQLSLLLVDALRAENPDVRLRIQNAVLFLAGEQTGVKLEQVLKDWKPAKNDSAADMEGKIQIWRAFWELPIVPTQAADRNSTGRTEIVVRPAETPTAPTDRDPVKPDAVAQ